MELSKHTKIVLFVGIGMVALILSFLNGMWIPVVLAVMLDIAITGVMIQVEKPELQQAV